MIYVLYLLVSAVVVLFVYFRWQHNALFHPKLYREDPFDERFRFLTITLDEGIVLEGCVYEPTRYKETLLYFGGRGQDSVGLLPKLSTCYGDFRIVTFNYRGYGKSGGVPDEKSIFQDALLVYDRVVKNFGALELLGFSLGCSVASYVASKRDPKRLFLIAPFASMKSLVKDVHGFGLPLLRYRFDTCAYLEKVECDVYIFISRDDNVVPYKNSKRFYACALVDIMELEGLTHVELLCDDRVIGSIAAYSSTSTPSQNSS